MIMRDQINKTQPKNFDKITKTPKKFPKTKTYVTKCMKCMKKRRKGRFRTLTKGLRLGLGRNLEWEKVFGENNVFRSREKRERDRDI